MRWARSDSRRTISAAVFLRGNSPKNSSMYWISRAPCSRSYCCMWYSTVQETEIVARYDGFVIDRRTFLQFAAAALVQTKGRPRGSEFVFARLRYDSGDWDYNP